jgi:hypothetical protein
MMRANRQLGAQLAEQNVVGLEVLAAANEAFIDGLEIGQPRDRTVLGVLVYKLNALKEDEILQHVVDAHGVGLVDLSAYEIPDDLRAYAEIDACWATWSVPFDREEEFFFVATAYYLSPAVRQYWEKRLVGPILWFGTTLEGVATVLEKWAARPMNVPRPEVLPPAGPAP